MDKKHQTPLGDPSARDFQIGEYPFYLFDRANHAYGEALTAALQSRRMDRARWQVLLCLRETNPSSVSELAQRASKELSTVSRVVERMRRDNLVTTAPRHSDQRVTEVFLEPVGQRTLDELLEVASTVYQQALSGFAPDEIPVLVKALRRILQNLDWPA